MPTSRPVTLPNVAYSSNCFAKSSRRSPIRKSPRRKARARRARTPPPTLRSAPSHATASLAPGCTAASTRRPRRHELLAPEAYAAPIEILREPLGPDPSLVKKQELVADRPRTRNVVGDDEHRRVRAMLQDDEKRIDLRGGDRIEPRARFVDEQDRRARVPAPAPARPASACRRKVRRHRVVFVRRVQPVASSSWRARRDDLPPRSSRVCRRNGNSTFAPTPSSRRAPRSETGTRSAGERVDEGGARTVRRCFPPRRRTLPESGFTRPTTCLKCDALAGTAAPQDAVGSGQHELSVTSSSTRATRRKRLGDVRYATTTVRHHQSPARGRKRRSAARAGTSAARSRIDEYHHASRRGAADAFDTGASCSKPRDEATRRDDEPKYHRLQGCGDQIRELNRANAAGK